MVQYPLTAFPTLLIPVAIYALAAIAFGGGEGGFAAVLNATALDIAMPAGAWDLKWGDLIVLAGLLALFIDLLKATGTGTATVFNHGLSMGVLIICLLLFLLAERFVTSTFFLLMCMQLLDVMAGFTITIIGARRDVSFDQ
jgi:hypothetical protein